MQRVFFFENTDYKKTTHYESDPNFIPLSVLNDRKAQKNGTKKTVYWVKKKPKDEDGKVKGETWTTSQQFIGDWKNNKKEGYGIKIYDNKDKYEGYWKKDMRHGKGTYWVCIGKNKYRKLYTGDWFENKKDGQGIYFYTDGSCYDGTWKNSKRDGKGLMIYANGDIYEGAWRNDLKHGYGILEKKNGDKYYGYWNDGLKEGQGYYYYHSTGKIYLGEWHEDAPRCGIFTDVDDENIKKEYKKHFKAEDRPPLIPVLKLNTPEAILEDSINNVHFLRNIKLAKTKTMHELFPVEFHSDLTNIFKQRRYQVTAEEKEEGDSSTANNKLPESKISVAEFKMICTEKLGQEVSDETLELIFYVFGLTLNEDSQMDFLLFCRFFYLIYSKNGSEEEEMAAEIDSSGYVQEDKEEDLGKEENFKEGYYNGDEEEGDVGKKLTSVIDYNNTESNLMDDEDEDYEEAEVEEDY